MKNGLHLLTVSLLFLFLSGCGSERSPESTGPFSEAADLLGGDAGADQVAAALMRDFGAVSDSVTGSLNQEASQRFVDLASDLSDRYPQDTAAALPLYRSAEVVRAMNNPERAAEIYTLVHQRYPTFSKAPESLFMLGFTYDEDLNQLEEARRVYTEFIERYPNNGFADDSQMLLDNLGKSDEEILRELEASQNQ